MGDDGIMVIADALKEAPRLKHFDCSHNEIGPAGF